MKRRRRNISAVPAVAAEIELEGRVYQVREVDLAAIALLGRIRGQEGDPLTHAIDLYAAVARLVPELEDVRRERLTFRQAFAVLELACGRDPGDPTSTTPAPADVPRHLH